MSVSRPVYFFPREKIKKMSLSVMKSRAESGSNSRVGEFNESCPEAFSGGLVWLM